MEKQMVLKFLLDALARADRTATPETKLVRLGLESLIIVQMLGELEQDVGKEIPIDLFWESETVDILAERIAQL